MASDEGAGGQVENQTAIHLLIEVEVEVVESSLWVAKLGLLGPGHRAFIARHEDALFLGPPGTGKSHLAQAIGQAAIQQGYRVFYRETYKLLDDLAEATIDGTRKEHMELLASVPLLIIDDLGMRKLPVTAAEELLEIVMRRYEREYFAHFQPTRGRLG